MTLSEAARLIKRGGIVAYPTETFYGLAAHPLSREAVKRIFSIKKRERGKPLPLILSSARELEKWTKRVGARERRLIKHFWPGPLTLVLKAKRGVPSHLTGRGRTLAVRVSSEPMARRLAFLSGGAITATSANLSGNPPLKTAKGVVKNLGEKIDGILSNKVLRGRKSSTILDSSSTKPKVLREGEILKSDLEGILGLKL